MLKLDSKGAAATDADFEKFNWKWVRLALLNVNTLFLSLNFFLIITPIYSFSLFLPTIITGLGYHQINAQLLTVPPNMGAFFLVLIVTWASDRIRRRGYFMLGGIAVAIGGYIMLIATPNTLIQYGGTFLVAAGIFPCSPIVMGWLANVSDFQGDALLTLHVAPRHLGKEAPPFTTTPCSSSTLSYVLTESVRLESGSALRPRNWHRLPNNDCELRSLHSNLHIPPTRCVSSFPHLAAKITLMVRSPRYITGHAINLGTLGAALVCTAALILYQKAENRKREQGKRDYRLEEEDEALLGYKHPRFRYTV